MIVQSLKRSAVILLLYSFFFGATPGWTSDAARETEISWAEPDTGSAAARQKTAPPSWPPLRAPDEAWVNSTFSGMSLDEKIGQMIMPTYSSSSAAGLISTYGVGGFIFVGNSNTSTNLLNATNELQSISPVPLLFSIDCEPGAGGRVQDATRFPMNMALAATDDESLAREQGAITARECRSLGIHIGFGPVVDVNTTPQNPIIGIRSYGDHALRTSRFARAHIEGANSQGLLCTLKHFPGHGDTDGDSHSSLPVSDFGLDELSASHLHPYRILIREGFTNLVMSAHVWYPAIDPGTTAWPATLSSNALTGILRHELGYQGTVISDSFGMAGLQLAANTYDGVRIGVQAGLDIILMPPSVADAHNGLRDAVVSSQIPISRIDASVRRILRMKSQVGLPEAKIVSSTLMTQMVSHPDHQAVAANIARRAITAARVETARVPIAPGAKVLCLVLSTSNQIFYRYASSYFTDAMDARFANFDLQTVSTSISSTQRASLVSTAASYDCVVVGSWDWKPTQPGAQVSLVQELLAAGRPVVYVSFGSPYHHLQFPSVQNYFCAFSSHFESQRQMAAVLAGVEEAEGQWPIRAQELGIETAASADWSLVE